MKHTKPLPAFSLYSSRVNRLVESSLFALGAGITVIVAVQVFCRYLLNASLFWSEELARCLLIWLTFLGATAAYKRQVHPGVDILFKRMSPAVQDLATRAVHLVSALFFAVMIYHGAAFAWFVRFQITPALHLPKWAVYSVVPVSGAILLFHCIGFVLEMHERGPSDDR